MMRVLWCEPGYSCPNARPDRHRAYDSVLPHADILSLTSGYCSSLLRSMERSPMPRSGINTTSALAAAVPALAVEAMAHPPPLPGSAMQTPTTHTWLPEQSASTVHSGGGAAAVAAPSAYIHVARANGISFKSHLVFPVHSLFSSFSFNFRTSSSNVFIFF